MCPFKLIHQQNRSARMMIPRRRSYPLDDSQQNLMEFNGLFCVYLSNVIFYWAPIDSVVVVESVSVYVCVLHLGFFPILIYCDECSWLCCRYYYCNSPHRLIHFGSIEYVVHHIDRPRIHDIMRIIQTNCVRSASVDRILYVTLSEIWSTDPQLMKSV